MCSRLILEPWAFKPRPRDRGVLYAQLRGLGRGIDADLSDKPPGKVGPLDWSDLEDYEVDIDELDL